MKVSSRGEYALRALLVLGQQQGRIYPINEIAKQTLVTVKYLEQILLQLRKLGYVHSKRGIQGGYMLRLSPTDINIGRLSGKLKVLYLQWGVPVRRLMCLVHWKISVY